MDDNDIKTDTESFQDMNLKPMLLRGIFSYGFETPSAIQKKAIVPFINGRDLIAQAQSGTGKTATFSIATLQIIDNNKSSIQALIVSPTRELAQQTYNIIKDIGKYLNLNFKLLIGGNPRDTDISDINMKIPHCIIGTPGRIADILSDKYCKIDLLNCKCLILDEADELLSDTFEHQTRNVVSYIGDNTQIGLYSATMSPLKIDIAKKFTNNPLFIQVKAEELTLEGIKQYYIDIERDEWKYDVLKDLYSSIIIYQLMIYCNTKRRVNYLTRRLTNDGFTCSFIHSDMSHKERADTMKEFRSGNNRILITTDLLARGIDIQQVSLIINYDLPNDIDNYLHRIGRSGRYGRKGISLNFLSKYEKEKMLKIEQFYQTQVEELPADLSLVFK